MQGINIFNTVDEFESYANPYDSLALTEDNQEVHLRDGRNFKYVIHAYYTVDKTVNGTIIGTDCDLTKIARIRITTPSGKHIYLNASRKYPFEELGEYTIDYGLFDTTTAPAYLLNGCTTLSNGLGSYLTYVQIDSDVTGFESFFISNNSKVTGAIFGNLDEYPETQVFDDPYSRNDIIIGDHVTSMGGRLCQGCPKVRNVYVGDGITSVGTLFYSTNDQSVYTALYIGRSVTGCNPQMQSKIRKYIVSPENETYLLDEETGFLLDKQRFNRDGVKVILTGNNGDDRGYLYVPSGYIINGYHTFCGKWGIKVADLRDYDYASNTDYAALGSVVSFTGFKDACYTNLIIMPRTVKYINRFNGGTSRANLLFFNPEPPIVDWGGDWNPFPGSSGHVYGYSFLNAGDYAGSVNPDYNLNIYVLAGTAEQQAHWTDNYDQSSTEYWGTERPNRWKSATSSWDEAPSDSRGDKNHTSYNNMTLQFMTEEELNSTIQTYIDAL